MDSTPFKVIFILLFLIFLLATYVIGYSIIKRYGSPFPKLFHEFDKKMGMTLGLGMIFFGSYFFFISSLSMYIKTDTLQQIFAFFYHFKVEAIYIGLTVFVCFTSTIYLTRLLIKYLYNSSKDS